jgi:hypothetical protein
MAAIVSVLKVITMGMVRIHYEQMEQLRECSAEMQKPLSRLVAEAVNYWLAVVAPAKLDVVRATPLKSACGEHAHQSRSGLSQAKGTRAGGSASGALIARPAQMDSSKAAELSST